MEINLELMDEIIEKYWNDDMGEFDYKGITGSWELEDTKWEDDNTDGDIEQYVFNITIYKKYIYKLNNLEGENELIETKEE